MENLQAWWQTKWSNMKGDSKYSFLKIPPQILSEIALLSINSFWLRLFICKNMAHFKKELSVMTIQYSHSLIQWHQIVSSLQARLWLLPQPLLFLKALNSSTSVLYQVGIKQKQTHTLSLCFFPQYRYVPLESFKKNCKSELENNFNDKYMMILKYLKDAWVSLFVLLLFQ